MIVRCLFLSLCICILWPDPSGAFTVEHRLVEHATPLIASGTKSAAAVQLLNEGVCRINNVLSESLCTELRNHVLKMRQDQATEKPSFQDLRNIPGTRLRFAEPISVPLNQRTDLLLPIEDTIVNNVLQRLAEELGPTLQTCAEVLPGPKARDVNGNWSWSSWKQPVLSLKQARRIKICMRILDETMTTRRHACNPD